MLGICLRSYRSNQGIYRLLSMSSSLYLTLNTLPPPPCAISYLPFLSLKQANASFPFPSPSYPRYNPLSSSSPFEKGVLKGSLHGLTTELLHFSLPGFPCHCSARAFLSLVSDSPSMCCHFLVLLLLIFLCHQALLIFHSLKFFSALW